MLEFGSANLLKVLVAALTSFPLGGIWYSALFGKPWAREADAASRPARSPGLVYGGMFGLSFVSALTFAFLLPVLRTQSPILTGCLIGLGFAATSLAANYLAAGRSLQLWLIDAGFHFFKFLLYGTVFALWP